MGAEEAAPCRHAGVPPQVVVDGVIRLIKDMGADGDYLRRYGLTPDEYQTALPDAIETMRGSKSAGNGVKRRFLESLFQAMHEAGVLSAIKIPSYGEDTVYRLTAPGVGDIAIIQKGCPDGAHSSRTWSTPDWAQETYLWWVCDSTKSDPGEHIKSGIGRLRQKFLSDAPDTIDGVIFHSPLCGTARRRCPKAETGMTVNDVWTPAPCIYVMPERRSDGAEWNWEGTQQRRFPAILLSAFGVSPANAPSYTGYVGFQRRGGDLRTTITSRYGRGRSTTFRS